MLYAGHVVRPRWALGRELPLPPGVDHGGGSAFSMAAAADNWALGDDEGGSWEGWRGRRAGGRSGGDGGRDAIETGEARALLAQVGGQEAGGGRRMGVAPCAGTKDGAATAPLHCHRCRFRTRAGPGVKGTVAVPSSWHQRFGSPR